MIARGLGLLVLAFLLLACGDSESQGTGLDDPDGSASVDASAAGGTGGGGGAGGGGGSGGSAGGAPDPRGPTLLVPGESVGLVGVTSDGYVVYTLEAGASISAVPIGGGASTPIARPTGATRLRDISERAFFLADVTNSTLTVWTHASGAHTTPNAVRATRLVVAANPEGTRVVFDRYGDGEMVFTGGNIDLSEQVELSPANDLGTCSASVAFAGDRFVTMSCQRHTEGASALFQLVTSFDASWTGTLLFNDDVRVRAHPGFGGRVFSAHYLHGFSWVPAAGGTPAIVAPDSFGVTDYLLSPDSAVVLLANVTLLSWSPTTNPSVVRLPASISQLFRARISPGNGHVLYPASDGAYLLDLSAGTANRVSELEGSGAPLNDGFTLDSKYALFSVTPVGFGDHRFAVPVSGGSPITIASSGTRGNMDTFGVGGSNILFVSPDGALTLRDLSATDASTTLARPVESFVLSPSKTAVAYVVTPSASEDAGANDGGPPLAPGLYAAPTR